MKNLICVFLTLSMFGCTINKNYWLNNHLLKLPKDELSLIATLAYIKHDNPDCTGDCNIKVACTYEFFDKCLESMDSIYYRSIGLDYNEKNIFLPNLYPLESCGKVSFGRATLKTDYYISPVLIDVKSREIVMQVRKKNEEKYLVVFNVLNNQLYFRTEISYTNDCDLW